MSDWFDDTVEAVTATQARRLAVAFFAPVWIPVILTLLLCWTFAHFVLGSIWAVFMQFVSWVHYGNRYVLGHYWFDPFDQYGRHERRTNEALEEQARKNDGPRRF